MKRASLVSAVLLGAAVMVSTGPAAAQSAQCWVGTLGEGNQEQRLVVTVAAAPATVIVWHLMGRTLSADTLRDVALTRDSMSFSFGQGDRTSTGRARMSADSLTGVLMRGAQSRPIRLARHTAAAEPANRLLGYWSGALESGGVIVLRAGLEFVPAPCGQVYATFDSPDQGSNDLPFTSLRLTGDSLRFALAFLDGSFAGVVSADSNRITGVWSQGAGTLDLRVTRGDSAVGRRPQEPVPPYPYDTLPVSYVNPDDGIRFAGTLTIPRGDGPFPAVLLITGSGAQNRDETVMGHKPFLVLADHLTRHGIATLRVDDRGVGGSTGDVMTATIADNAGDALAGVAFLQTRQRIDPRRIGLLGHSEGGWVAPLAATRSTDIAFLVLLAAPAVTGEEIRHAQDSVMALVSGASPEYVAAERSISEALYAALKAEPNDSVALVSMAEASQAAYQRLPPAQQRRVDSVWAGVDLSQVWQPLTTRWFRYLLTYDPRPALAGVRVPVLALFGGKDVQVPPAQSVPVMESAWRAHPAATVRVYSDLNHLFQHAQTGLVEEYGRIEETIAPQVLTTISDWIGSLFRTTR